MIIRSHPFDADMLRMGPWFGGNGRTGVPAPGVTAVRQAIPRDWVPVAPLFPGSIP